MKTYSASTFVFSFILFLSLSPSHFAHKKPRRCNPQDQKAINQIQKAFGVNPTPDCCDWDVVTCDNAANYRVVNLLIFNSNISGQIPAAISDLSSLQILELVNVPKITGNIPPAITKLSKLVTLVVSKASLSGPIPDFLVNLKTLTFLDLSFNALTGSIPPHLSQFPYFQVLNLDGNKLTGNIPESFGHFSKSFLSLSLSRNFLTGTIPNSLGNLNLYTIDLSQNNLIGDASFLFGKNKRTEDVILNKNNLKFDLSKVKFSKKLRNLKLNHNNIYGSLSQELTKLDFLNFNVSYNNLCGKIPQGGKLQYFEIDSYFHNKCLCGAPLSPCK